MDAIVTALAVSVLLLGVLVAGLLRAHAEILRNLHVLMAERADGPDGPDRPLGRDASALPMPVARPGLTPVDGPGAFVAARPLAGLTCDGADVVVGTDDAHLLLAFLSTQCQTCQVFWRALAAGDGPQLPQGMSVIVVTKDEPLGLVRDKAAGLPVVVSSRAWREYEVPVAPYFVHILDGRVVGTGAASTWKQVVGLVATSLTAGLRTEPASTGHDGGRRVPRSAQDRAEDVDAELAAAGIHPGDPRLWPAAGIHPGDPRLWPAGRSAHGSGAGD